jgi:hypothetical protein
MQILFITPIRDIQSHVLGQRTRIDGSRGRDGGFPFFLHFGVHYQEGVVWEVDRDLALGVGETAVVFPKLAISCVYLTDAELTGYAKAETSDDCTRA